MDLKPVVISQYNASLQMLGQAVEGCPDEIWDAAEDATPFWRVAYHALFYAHLYLQPAVEQFRPWEKHWEGAEKQGKDAPAGKPFTKEEVLAYLAFCHAEVQARTADLEPEAPSGFFWLPMNKLELQFYAIRHVQQHTGELMERLGARAGIELHWVGKGE